MEGEVRDSPPGLLKVAMKYVDSVNLHRLCQ